ncbi:MAG: C40 family peptidase [Bacteroidales bacterium]|jgi:hypothetical protein|nr:C40 family peptidase [Bacteroidales bacterium]
MENIDLKPIGYGIGHLSVIPLRKHPFHTAEMTSQILFGETFVVYEKYYNWNRVRCSFDNYEGWVNQIEYQSISEETFVALSNRQAAIVSDMVEVMYDHTRNRMFPVLIGSTLPGYKDQAFEIEGIKYSFEGEVTMPSIGTNCRKLIENAWVFLQSPYLWGGRTPFGIDCSGFVQLVFKLCGISLQRDSSQQATQGEVVNLLSESHPGDLAFFDNEDGQITHVGLMLDNQTIIHASGKVRSDKIDHHGIFNEETKQYTHKLRLIRRIL